MSGFPILDLVAGMVFIYFMLSIISSSTVEIILTMRQLRAKMLEKWLRTIFDNPVTIGNKTISLGQAIMDHCATTALSGEGKSNAYMDARNFTSALLEKITYDPANPVNIAHNLDDLIQAISDSPILSIELKRSFLGFANEARDTYQTISSKAIGELQLFRNKIEHWFDTSMERVGGTLKNTYTRFWTFWTALIITGLLNADSISLVRYLYNNPTARAAIAADAYKEAIDSTGIKKITQLQHNRPGDSATLEDIKANVTAQVNNIKEVKATLQDAIPLGWTGTSFKNSKGELNIALLISKIIGLAATVLAIMMGAPFWFDVLNKISNLRGTGKKPSESSDATNAEIAAPAAQPVNVTINPGNINKEEEAVG